MNNPSWLPSLLDIVVIQPEDWLKIENDLFEIYLRDFVHTKCFYDSLEILIDRGIEPRCKLERTFWKLISKQNSYDDIWDRSHDLERARRLPLCKSFIVNHADNFHFLEWDFEENTNKIRTYIWFEFVDYIVIIEKKSDNTAFLISGHYVDGASHRSKYRQKYDNRVI